MAILKSEIKRINVLMPTAFLNELDKHLKNFALTDRSQWLIEAARERMAKEKIMLSEIKQNKEIEENG
jgi:metal-responsive CopG/Arc/MetJ family transcriptional regulator